MVFLVLLGVLSVAEIVILFFVWRVRSNQRALERENDWLGARLAGEDPGALAREEVAMHLRAHAIVAAQEASVSTARSLLESADEIVAVSAKRIELDTAPGIFPAFGTFVHEVSKPTA